MTRHDSQSLSVKVDNVYDSHLGFARNRKTTTERLWPADLEGSTGGLFIFNSPTHAPPQSTVEPDRAARLKNKLGGVRSVWDAS